MDLALVLHRNAWGLGATIHREVLRRTFELTGRDSVTVLLPPSRGRAHALLRLGYLPDGTRTIHHQFLR